MQLTALIICLVCFSIGLFFLLCFIWLLKKQSQAHTRAQSETLAQLSELKQLSHTTTSKVLSEQQQAFATLREALLEQQINNIKSSQKIMQEAIADMRVQLLQMLQQSTNSLSERFKELNKSTGEQLRHISGQVDKRLTEGFEKTNATFTDVIKRLALIDAAQKKIAELSTDVVSLQDLLADKRSRGAFGEVQLSSLIRNTLPAQHYDFQHTLSNGKRVDCILYLPAPTGNIAIDSKFPLENYQQLANCKAGDANSKTYERAFIQDIKKHIDDIASKYIIKDETATGAVMFIPAEAIFAKIHADHPELVEYAHRQNVWLVSPTTMMAILTTARAVLKDSDTKEQIHIIQEHLHLLAKDFKRFDTRMQKLARHIDQAHEDVKQVNTSARKITERFEKIEGVELHPQQDLLSD